MYPTHTAVMVTSYVMRMLLFCSRSHPCRLNPSTKMIGISAHASSSSTSSPSDSASMCDGTGGGCCPSEIDAARSSLIRALM